SCFRICICICICICFCLGAGGSSLFWTAEDLKPTPYGTRDMYQLQVATAQIGRPDRDRMIRICCGLIKVLSDMRSAEFRDMLDLQQS
ncbi:MAG: hypothetical protein IJ523_09505, partial [Succinivibrionaceae bacterium]|nr:hypothetical protein [Succinivibrionaceae bacterium]